MMGMQPRWADTLPCPHGKLVGECMRCALGLEDVTENHHQAERPNSWALFGLGLCVGLGIGALGILLGITMFVVMHG